SGTPKRVFRYDIVGPVTGNATALFNDYMWSEKGYTAPFLSTGTHYVIIAPAVVFAGQSFWLTIAVIDSTATTKQDYCGITSFTSTDPAALLAGTGMDAYNYTWTSNTGGCGVSPF